MSTNQKYHITKWASLAGIPLTLLLLGKIQENGLNGDEKNAKRWFFIMLVFVSIEIIVTLMHFYYRNKLNQPAELNQIAVETLAKLQKSDIETIRK